MFQDGRSRGRPSSRLLHGAVRLRVLRPGTARGRHHVPRLLQAVPPQLVREEPAGVRRGGVQQEVSEMNVLELELEPGWSITFPGAV